MKKVLLLFVLMLSVSFLTAQLVNNGATITIMPGATLYAETDVINNTGGTIDVQGNLVLTGDLTNNATMTTTAASLVRFTGSGNSDFKSNAATVQNLRVDKTTGNVNLVDDLDVATNLDFVGGLLVLGANELYLGATTTITGAGAGKYIATDGTGRVRKALTGDATVDLPLGDLTNYSPLSMDVTGTAYSSAYVRARVENATHPNLPAGSTDYISRYWQINQSGITAYSNQWTGTYVVADDEVGSNANIKGAAYDSDNGNWSFNYGTTTPTSVSGTILNSNEDVTGTNFFGNILAKAFLAGAYSPSTGLMTTTLNTSGLIPLTSPYTDAPATATAIPAGVTDWVKLEIRDANTPSSVLGKVSAFIKNDGNIIGVDGKALIGIKDSPANVHVSVHHRNHLPIRTPAAVDVKNPTLHDFTTAQSQAYQDGLITTNDAMRYVTGTNPAYCMWNCDAFGTNNVLNSTDFSYVRSQTVFPQNGYLRTDVNMSGFANSTDVSLTRNLTVFPKIAHL